MLIDFTVKNFRSIKETQTFSMETINKIKEFPENTFEANGHQLLKSALLYGRNSAGKSNMLKAFGALRKLVKDSYNFKLSEKIKYYEPFLFDVQTQQEAVEFGINFIAKDGVKYNYEIAFTQTEIVREQLYHYPNKIRAKLFERKKGREIEYGNLKGQKKEIENSLYPNQLFLSKVGVQRLDSLIPAYDFFNTYFYVQAIHDSAYDKMLITHITRLIREDTIPFIEENINALLQEADTGIEALILEEKSSAMNGFQLKTKHAVYKDNKVINSWELPIEQESTGTIKFLSIIGLLLDALSDGSTMLIDELDKSLHPHLTALLIQLFHSKRNNPHNAQLIFVTHDSNLMDSKTFRRDQLWIAEKNEQGSTELYSIADFKGVRKGIDYEKYYLEGAFGGIPVINTDGIILKF